MTGTNRIWLIGAGPMAQAYARVLADQNEAFEVVGRGAMSADAFEAATGAKVRRGGLIAALAETAGDPPTMAIVATSVDSLAENVHALITAGVGRILVEKPAGLTPNDTDALVDAAERAGADVYVAYNRRFYASFLRAKELIREDGGAASLRLEFSEFSHRIPELPSSAAVKEAWLYANSTHVLDMGFALAGFPRALSARASGSLDWHPAGARFVGHGVTDAGADFSYFADWGAAPRWMVEVGTRRRTIVFQPLEKLRYRERTGFAEVDVELDDDLDARFKPGVWRQCSAFASGGGADSGLCALSDHARHMRAVYATIRSGGELGPPQRNIG